jgi:DNA-binding Lrp family transcriptional regulator
LVIAMTEKLDDKDLQILEMLRANSRLSEQKIAKKTGIPMTTVHNRAKKMREQGIIEGYTVRLNHAKLGKPLTAYVLLRAVNQADQNELLEYISKIPQVCEVAMVTGDFDLMLKARISDMEELNKIVVANLRKHKGIGESITMISYRTVEKA